MNKLVLGFLFFTIICIEGCSNSSINGQYVISDNSCSIIIQDKGTKWRFDGATGNLENVYGYCKGNLLYCDNGIYFGEVKDSCIYIEQNTDTIKFYKNKKSHFDYNN
jgi:hypothetical protein